MKNRYYLPSTKYLVIQSKYNLDFVGHFNVSNFNNDNEILIDTKKIQNYEVKYTKINT